MPHEPGPTAAYFPKLPSRVGAPLAVVSVAVRLDGDPDLLTYPGFHQLFFYGDHKRDLASFAKLFSIDPLLV
jgi:hypothetical protein